MDTHAVPQSSKPFLVNQTLMVLFLKTTYQQLTLTQFLALQTNSSQISKLQQNERFSPVYHIVMPWVGSGGPGSPRNYPGRFQAA